MIIQSLKTVNYRQHRGAKTWTFGGNLVGVIGRNGSGKSHLIDAIEFLFTGKVGRQNKSDMLSWGEQKGSVSGTFIHDGNEGTITRDLHSNGATFKFRDADAKGITSVNSSIAEMTGMDAEICRQAVFVHQKEIDAILFTDPSIRQLAWQRLCGLSMANGIHTDLGTVISKLPPLTDWSEQIEGCESRIQELDRQIKQASDDLEITRSGMGLLSAEQVRKYLDDLTALSGLMAQAVEDNKKLAALHDDLQRGRAKQEDLQRKFPAGGESPTPRLNAVLKDLTTASQIFQVNADLENRVGWEKAYSQQLAALVPPAVDQAGVDGLGKELAGRKADEAVQRSQLSLYRQLYSALCGLTADSTCPLCTQVLAAGTNLKALVEVRIAEFEAKARQADNDARRIERQIGEARYKIGEFEAAANQLKQQLAGAASAVEGLRRQLADLQKGRLANGVDQALLTALEQEKLQLAREETEFKLFQKETAWTEAFLEASKTSIARLSVELDGRVATIQRKMAELTVSDPNTIGDLIPVKRKEVDRLVQTQNQISLTTGRLTEMRNQLQNLGQTLEDLQRKKAAQANQYTATQTLTRVRDWFHYTNGPQTVINSLHGRITAGVNDFLKRFGASFYVMPDAGSMSFRYCYHDGRPMPEGFPTVDQLSGGEAVVLAVSFRMATYCLFAGRVGLLTLDEPTVYLDDEHINQFCTLLSRVKEIATGMNLQIFISTHELSVIPFVDSVINLNPKV